MNIAVNIAEGLELTRESFIGERVAVLGVSGTGKTNTVAVIVEELLASGLGMTIVDTEGEYYGLRQAYELVVVGCSPHVDLPIGPEHAAALARTSVEQNLSIVLDVSGYKKKEAYQVLEAYFLALWEICSEKKRPYEVVLEEAHVWIPQDANSPLKELLTEIALRGRKRGLGILLASQRSPKVEKDILTQVPLLFLHQVVHPIDKKLYQQLVPRPSKEVDRMVEDLQRGQAIFRQGNVSQVVSVRKRDTFHPGATPEFGEVDAPELRRIDAALLEQLQDMLAASVQVKPVKSEKVLEKRIAVLEDELAARDALIEEQLKQIELLSRLTVVGNGSSEGRLSSTLEIAHATVHRVDLPQIERRVVESTQTQTALVSGKISIDERAFDSLLRRLKQVAPLELQILAKLVEKKRPLSVKELAAWLNKSEATVRNNPPMTLIQLDLIRRERVSGGYRYESVLSRYLGQEFPGADVQQLQTRLLSSL